MNLVPVTEPFDATTGLIAVPAFDPAQWVKHSRAINKRRQQSIIKKIEKPKEKLVERFDKAVEDKQQLLFKPVVHTEEFEAANARKRFLLNFPKPPLQKMILTPEALKSCDQANCYAESVASWQAPELKLIKRRVSALHHVSVEDIDSPRRDKKAVLARQHFHALARKYTAHSLPEIARRTGGRDHTTILHSVRKFAQIRQKRKDARWQIRASSMNSGQPIR